MNVSKKLTQYMGVVVLSLGLAACGGAPSEGEMKDAMQREADQLIKAMGPFAQVAGMEAMQILKVEKVGCDKDGDKAYRCDMKVVAKVQGKEVTQTTRGRFVKTSDGWQASK